MTKFHIKTNRTFTFLRRNAWLFTIVVAIGGLFQPRLGLLVIPVILALTLMSIFRGRYWCGNFCPHGSLYDRISLRFSRNTHIPEIFRSRILRLAFFVFFGFMLTRKIISAFSALGSASFFDRLGFGFVASYLMVLILGGILSILFAPRTWCHFCPMGFLQTLGYRLGRKVAPVTRTDTRITALNPLMCHQCGKCARVCPMQLSPYQEFRGDGQFDHEKCIRCSTCVENCPAKILSLSTPEAAKQQAPLTDLTGYRHRTTIAAVIRDIRSLPGDVTEYTFQTEEKLPPIEAGQFILVRVPGEASMFRAFSISFFDRSAGTIRVTIKKAPMGYGSTRIMETYRAGDPVELQGPMGRELVVDKDSRRLVLVAGGIGITPFLPILEDLKNDPGQVEQVTLIYGVNRSGEFLYQDELDHLVREYPAFHFIPVVAFEPDYPGETGFVTDVLKKTDLAGAQIYMCGPLPMVSATLKVFRRMEIPEEYIRYESA